MKSDEERTARNGLLRRGAAVLLTGIVYFLSARLGLLLAFQHKNVSPVWPPSGVAVAVLLAFGLRLWPGIALGAFLANYTTGLSLQTASAIAIGNTLEGVTGAFLLTRAGSFRSAFARLHDVPVLIGTAAISAVVAATIGVTSLVASGAVPARAYGSAWSTWWLGDAMGILVLGYALCTWIAWPPSPGRLDRAILWRCVEAAALIAALCGVTVFVFTSGRQYPYAVFPALIWAAFRFGTRGAGAAVLLVSGVAVWVTLHGTGPFVEQTTAQSLVYLQTFMAAVAITTFQLGSATSANKTADDRVRRANAFRAHVLESAVLGMGVLDLQGNITLANPCLASMLGYSVPELTGKAFRGFLPAPDVERFTEQCAAAVHDGRPVHDPDTRLLRADGATVPVSLGYARLEQKDAATGVVVTVADMTARKKLEEQLLQSQRMESLGRLAGGIAHDFNNILTAIIGYTELAEADLTPGHPARESLKQVTDASQVAANLTSQLVAFARRQIIEPRVVAVNDLVMRIEPMLRRLTPENVAMSIALGAGPHNVMMDPGQFEQILVNLVVNACDAMPDGGAISIETASVRLPGAFAGRSEPQSAGEYVVLTVTDTGCGIDESVRPNIFDPFYTTKPPGQGTGLGLATVHGIVAQAGGHILADSRPGSGARFRVFLPRARPSAAGDGHTHGGGEIRHGTETILLAEDEPAIRTLAACALRGRGYSVLEAGDGEEAIRVAEESDADIALLITDVVMPRVGGKELADRLSALRPNIRVIYLSGYNDALAADDGLDLIAKPFTPSALAHRVREALDRGTAAPVTATGEPAVAEGA